MLQIPQSAPEEGGLAQTGGDVGFQGAEEGCFFFRSDGVFRCGFRRRSVIRKQRRERRRRWRRARLFRSAFLRMRRNENGTRQQLVETERVTGNVDQILSKFRQFQIRKHWIRPDQIRAPV